MNEQRKTGIYVDLDKEFYRLVRMHCVKERFKVKEFVYLCLKEGMKNGKKSAE